MRLAFHAYKYITISAYQVTSNDVTTMEGGRRMDGEGKFFSSEPAANAAMTTVASPTASYLSLTTAGCPSMATCQNSRARVG